MVDAQWQVADEHVAVVAEGRAGWCPGSGMVLVDAVDGDRTAGVHWHFDSLAPATYRLEMPTVPESTVTGASAVVRYVHLDEIRGYRSLSGVLKVERIDSSKVTGEVTSVLQLSGGSDSTALTMTFDRIPLVIDSTLCVAPKPAPDTLADTLAPSPATEP